MKRKLRAKRVKWTREMGAYEAVYLYGRVDCAKRAMRLLGAARARARQKGLEYLLDDGWSLLSIQAVLERGECELTGLPFGEGPLAPTLDRIIPARGYVPGNVRVICRLMNAALGNWGEDELRKVMTVWLAKPPSGEPFDMRVIRDHDRFLRDLARFD